MSAIINYASEEGLKELYRRAVARIPAVDTELDFDSGNPIANSTITYALSRLGSYVVVKGTGSDHHPDVAEPSDTVLYFVKVASVAGKDNYKEWIWTDKWECIGEPSITIVDSVDINSYDPVTSHAVALALANFGGFEKVNGTGTDNHPDVQNPSNKVIYLVEVSESADPDHCMEWVWSTATGTPEWVCIGTTSISVDTQLDAQSNNPIANSVVATNVTRLDTRIDDISLVLTDVTGSVTGTTMYVNVDNSTYTRFSVPATITTLAIRLTDKAVSGNVSRSMFEFTLPADTELQSVRVLDMAENDCLYMCPMTWPGTVTYQGTVTNGIATIIGYSPAIYNGEVLSTDTGNLLTTSTGKHIKYVVA